MKQSGILDITGLKDVCAVLQFIDEVSMIRFIDIFGVLKLQETLNSSVSSVLKLLHLFCRRNLSFCRLQQNILDVSLDWICEKLELNYLLTVFFLSILSCGAVFRDL